MFIAEKGMNEYGGCGFTVIRCECCYPADTSHFNLLVYKINNTKLQNGTCRRREVGLELSSTIGRPSDFNVDTNEIGRALCDKPYLVYGVYS